MWFSVVSSLFMMIECGMYCKCSPRLSVLNNSCQQVKLTIFESSNPHFPDGETDRSRGYRRDIIVYFSRETLQIPKKPDISLVNT